MRDPGANPQIASRSVKFAESPARTPASLGKYRGKIAVGLQPRADVKAAMGIDRHDRLCRDLKIAAHPDHARRRAIDGEWSQRTA